MAESKPPIPSSPSSRALKDVAFGTIAGLTSRLFEHPFDLCKVRLQAQLLDPLPRFSGPIDCLYQTWKHEGVRGLYRGLPAPMAGAMAEDAVLFLAYGQLLHAVRRLAPSSSPPGADAPAPPTLGQVALAGAGAGAITSFVLTPIELVKCRMQVQLLSPSLALPSPSPSPSAALPSPPSAKPIFRSLPGISSVVRTVLRTEGVHGLWLGQTGTLIRELGGCAVWFGANDVAARYFLRRRGRVRKADLRAWESVGAGAVAGVSACVVCYPADTVKSAIQTDSQLRPAGGGAGRKERTTFGRTLVRIWRAQGVRGLYAGMGITLGRSAVSSGMIFLIWDELGKRFG